MRFAEGAAKRSVWDKCPKVRFYKTKIVYAR